MNEFAILIVASHPLIGRLLADFVRGAGYSAGVPEPGELPAAALQRAAPQLALIDFRHASALNPDLRARMAAASVEGVLFSGGVDRAEMEMAASFLRWRSFVMPISQGELADVLHSALAH